MKKTSRRVWAGLILAAGLSVVGLVGCSGSGGHDGAEATGEMRLPLTTQGASGATYRLRNATFLVQNQNDYYYGNWEAGAGGADNSGSTTVSSETDPNAKNISLSLEEGYYIVQLKPGWHLEKSSSAGAQTVEATLLSGATQWVYVSRQSTSWAEFSFGIGGREIWLNGKLNVGIDVQEAPGSGGEGGGTGDVIEPVGGDSGI
ncbi:MAG: hypothetical protein ABW061_21100 [Polyangiaceae bacterium]